MSQQDFTTIVATKKRFTVVVSEVEQVASECAICTRNFDAADVRPRTVICAVCNREVCYYCTPYEYGTQHFPMRFVCDNCDQWSTEDQLKIAAFMAELNK